MKPARAIPVVVLVLGLVAGALWMKAGRSPVSKIVVTGASTVAPLMTEIAKRFEAAHPGVRVDVQSGGSGRGVSDARDGTAQVGMVSRDLKPDESDLTPTLIARDGVAIVVHRDNPISGVSEEQVRNIYLGKHRRWSELGGADVPIVVVNKAEGRSTLEVFLARLKLRLPEVRADVVIGDNEHGIKVVAGNAHAIGYVSIGAAQWAVNLGTAIRVLPLAPARGGMPPQETLVERPLLLVTRGATTPLVDELVRFAASAAVSDLLRAQYLLAPHAVAAR